MFIDNRRVSFWARRFEQVLMSIAGVLPSIIGLYVVSGFADICYRRATGFIMLCFLDANCGRAPGFIYF